MKTEGTKTANATVLEAGPDAGLKEGQAKVMLSVYDVVDSDGDRVKAGEWDDFVKSFAESGDPIPMLFAHDHRNLDAYIGEITDFDTRATNAKQQTGLAAIVTYDLDDASGAKAYKLAKGRRVKQWSYHYAGERVKAEDGVNDLRGLSMTEGSMVLRGANDQTDTLAIKSAGDQAINPVALAVQIASALKADGRQKSYVDVEVDGSFEQTQDALRSALAAKYPSPADSSSGWIYVNLVATTPTDVTYQVCYEGAAFEGQADAMYQASYTMAADGTATLGDPAEVQVAIAAKARNRTDDGRYREEKDTATLLVEQAMIDIERARLVA